MSLIHCACEKSHCIPNFSAKDELIVSPNSVCLDAMDQHVDFPYLDEANSLEEMSKSETCDKHFEYNHDILRFIPHFLRKPRIFNKHPIEDGPWCEKRKCAIMFADILGFTALTEGLAKRGAEGVEKITQILNTYFSLLIDIVHSNGGDVIKFAGDALLALWDASDDDLLLSTCKAASCALRIQEELSSMTSQDGVKLSLRISVTCGDLHIGIMGGNNGRWESFLTGKPLREAGVACENSLPGDVMISSDAQSLLESISVSVLSSGGFFHLKSISARPESMQDLDDYMFEDVPAKLKNFIPVECQARIDAGQLGWLNELRRVTVVFVNLPNMNENVSMVEAQQIFIDLQDILHKYGGSLNKLSVDDKGISLLAGFGMPSMTHGNDAARAVLAALQMHRHVSMAQWRCSIGIATGKVFIGIIGSEQRCEYTMIGDAVNFSARLMHRARGKILCDTSTKKVCKEAVIFGEPLVETIKGKAGLCELWPVIRQQKVTTGSKVNCSGSMIGRKEEREVLAQMASDIAMQKENVNKIIFVGEAGLGKTRLATEFLKIGKERGLNCFLASADEVQISTPFHPWRSIFQHILGVDEFGMAGNEFNRRYSDSGFKADHQAMLKEKLTVMGLSEAFVKLTPLLDSVLSIGLEDNQRTRKMRGEIRAKNTQKFLCEILRLYCMSTSFVLVVDDGQWFDSMSWALISLVSKIVPTFHVVLFTRPMPSPQPTEFKNFEMTCTRYVLQSMTDEDCVQLVVQILGVDKLPLAIEDLIRDRAQGSPLFSSELALSLRESLNASGENLSSQLDELDLSNFTVSDTIEGLITSRIDRLTASQQLTLKVASVIGREFDFLLLIQIHPTENESSIESDLDVLRYHELITPCRNGRETSYIFKHAAIQEISYSLLPESRKIELHSRVVEVLELQHGNVHITLHPILAQHCEKAKIWDKALRYLSSSGGEALRNRAHIEAIDWFKRALHAQTLSSAMTTEERASLYQKLGEAQFLTGDFHSCQLSFKQALELVGRAIPSSRHGYWLGCVKAAVEFVLIWLFPRLWRRGTKEGYLHLIQIYERLFHFYYYLGNPLKALYFTLQMLKVSVLKEATTCRRLSFTSMLGLALQVFGMRSISSWVIKQSLEGINAQSDVSSQAKILLWGGVHKFSLGRTDESAVLFKQSLEFGRRIGDQRTVDEVSFNYGLQKYMLNQYECAKLWAQKIRTSTEKRNNWQGELWGLCLEIACEVRLERLSRDALLSLLSRLADHLRFSNRAIPSDTLLGMSVMAMGWLKVGERTKALACCSTVGAILRDYRPVSIHTSWALMTLSGVVKRLQEGEEGSREELQELKRSIELVLRRSLRNFQILTMRKEAVEKC